MFNIKTLVAVAALAVAGSASATVLNPVGTTNGGEMSLTLWSESAQVSYIFDTGIMLADFRTQAGVAGFKYEVDLSADAEYQNFLALVGSATDVKFAFFGGDNSGNAATARTMITTVSGDPSQVTNGNMVNAMNQMQSNYLVTTSGTGQTGVNGDPRIQAAANASATFQKGVHGAGYYGEWLGDDLGLQFQPVTAAKGTSVGIYDFVRSSTSGGALAVVTPLGGDPLMTATYSGNNFVVTAVPEPESYALMVAGLAVMGAAAARRRAAK